MPTTRRRRMRTRAPEFTRAHIAQHVTGWDHWGIAYGDGTRAGGPGPDLELMRDHWQRYRAEILAADTRKTYRSHLRPWSWWRFEHDFERPPRPFVDEAAELQALGEWTAEDAAQLAWRVEGRLLRSRDLEQLDADAIGVEAARRVAASLEANKGRVTTRTNEQPAHRSAHNGGSSWAS